MKRLGDDVTQLYQESVLSLERRLAPTCGGYYTLVPCSNFPFPLDPKMVRTLGREIERLAPSMQDGNERPIEIPRRALLVIRPRDRGVILGCCHNDFPEILEAARRLSNVYGSLVDQGQMEHSFVTDEARESFIQAVVAVAESGQSQTITWNEEWPLTRHDGNDNGVWVLGTSGAFDVQDSVAASTERMLDQAVKKFRGKKWAPIQIIAFDAASPHMTTDRVRAVLSTFDAEEFADVDIVVLVSDQEASVVWSRQTAP